MIDWEKQLEDWFLHQGFIGYKEINVDTMTNFISLLLTQVQEEERKKIIEKATAVFNAVHCEECTKKCEKLLKTLGSLATQEEKI